MLTIAPSAPLHGTLTLPGDKSISHRAALFAALAEGESVIENFLIAGVTRSMLDALTALGVNWSLDGTTLTVQGRGVGALDGRGGILDCGHSGTTLRMLAGAIAAAGTAAVLDGSPGLRKRPMGRIVEPLQKMGVPVHAEENRAPITFDPRQSADLRSGIFDLKIASAQVKSCILLAGLNADGPVTVVEPGPSRDHTERMLAGMGVDIETKLLAKGARRVGLQPPDTPLVPLRLELPGDFSSAAFLIVSALVSPGSEVTLQGVGLNPTRTGLLDALRAMNADIRIATAPDRQGEPAGDITVRHSRLSGAEIAGELVVRMIDEFPIFSIAAAYADGTTTVRDAQELRYKESDRIAALCGQLQAIGVKAVELPDGFRIRGGRPQGGTGDPHGDHRLAMSLAVAGLGAHSPVRISRPEIIRESFPGFQAALEHLGAHFDD